MNNLRAAWIAQSRLPELAGFFFTIFHPSAVPGRGGKTNIIRYYILKCLLGQKGQNLTGLSNRLKLKKNTLSELLERMLQDGLLLRSGSRLDRRKAYFSPTPKGERAVRDFEGRFQKRLDFFFQELDGEQRRSLVASLNLLIRLAKQNQPHPGPVSGRSGRRLPL